MSTPQVASNPEIKTGKNVELQRVIIYTIIIALGWLMPAMGGITELGWKVIGIFVGSCYGWSVSSQIWPSMFAVVLLPLTGVVTLPELIAGGYGSETALLLIGIFVLLKYLEEEGVSEYIAAWMLSRKILEGHPWRFCYMILLVAYLITSLINIVIGVLLVWGIIYSICKTLGYKPFDKFPTVLIIGVGVMGAFSLSAMPWGQNSIVLLAFFEKVIGHPVNIANYVMFTVPLGLAGIACYLLLCKFVFRLDVSKLKKVDKSFLDPKYLELTQSKKIALAALIIFIVTFLAPNFMPKAWSLTQFLGKLGYVGKLFIIFVVLSCIRVDGKYVFNFAKLASKGIQWTMFGIFWIVIPLGAYINNPATGVTDMLTQNLMPIFNGMSPFVFFMAITVITILVSALLANMPVAMMLMPVTLTAAKAFGLNPEQMGFLIIVACTVDWMTPAGSPAGALLYINKEWLRIGDIMKYGLPTLGVMTVLTFLMGYFWMGMFY